MQTNNSSSLRAEAPWWSLLGKSFKKSLRTGPKAYFATLIGAIVGAIEYSSAVHRGLPRAQSRIRVYANAMRAVTEQDMSDDDRATLMQTLLRWGRDKTKPVSLSGDLDQGLTPYSGGSTQYEQTCLPRQSASASNETILQHAMLRVNGENMHN